MHRDLNFVQGVADVCFIQAIPFLNCFCIFVSLQAALFKDWDLHTTAFLPLGGQPVVEGDMGYCSCSSVEEVSHSPFGKMERQVEMK